MTPEQFADRMMAPCSHAEVDPFGGSDVCDGCSVQRAKKLTAWDGPKSATIPVDALLDFGASGVL